MNELNEELPTPPNLARPTAPNFTEKTFYLEEFYGKSILFAMVPPSGERLSELDSLVVTLRQLRRNQTRCIVISSADALPRLVKRLGRMLRHEPALFNPATKKADRAGIKALEDGRKVRVFKANGEQVDA